MTVLHFYSIITANEKKIECFSFLLLTALKGDEKLEAMKCYNV